MAEEEVVVAPAVSDLKRKLDDLDPEAQDPAQPSPNSAAVEANADGDVAEADEAEAKRPRHDEDNEKADGIASINGLKEGILDEAGDAENLSKDAAKEEVQETVEVKTEQVSSVEDRISGDKEHISVKEETKEVLVSVKGETEEASVTVKEETKEVTVEGEESLEPSNEEPRQESDDSKLDEPASNDASTVTRRIEVPNNKVGVLIGKAGDTIRYLQYNSGAKIQITRDAEADPYSTTRPVEIVGTLSNINKAEKLISAVIAEADAGGSPSLVARGLATAQAAGIGEQVEIKVPNEKVGLIIGRGGETIKGLQTRSGARIQLIPQHLPEGDGSKERTVRVTGDMRQIEIAQEMIKDVLNQTVRPSPLSGGFNQQSYRPRGPSGPPQWGPRGPPPSQPMGYDYQQRGPYPSQNSQYPPATYGGYPSQQMGPRSNFGGPPSMHGPPHGGAGCYDYYGGQGGHDHPGSVAHSTPNHGHGPGPTLASAGGPPPSQANYNYGQPHGHDYGHQPPYAQTTPQQGYGHGYDEPKYDNHAQMQHPYGGHGNSQAVYSQGSMQPGFPQQQQYGKPPSYNMPPQGQPQSYGPPRPGQPGDMPYQGSVPSAQSYGANVPHQQQYPYATSGAMQQTYPAYGSAPATEGYNQQAAASGPGYPQQVGQSVPSYTQLPSGQQAAGYGQVAATGGYAYTNSQQGYPEQPGTTNASYGYQGTQDPNYGGSGPASAYTAPASGQQAYAQPTVAQPSYEQAAAQPAAYGVAQGSAPVGYGKTVSPQPGYPQYDATQMYAAPR
ncbi:far upstream element-binding protein 2-like isoform X2 [Pistacia vera]|uniref:far upstream element-binding protein 2-like isoform X2 n=1 Tax=Pistacia vera TaxID=55513 RepID=UPI0012633189|nr:far upstream element-binding protein 2-like isoform X2 [Pistacia vera]